MSKVKKSTKKRKPSLSETDVFKQPESTANGAVNIFQIFKEVQWNDAFHNKSVKQMKKIYKNTPFELFVEDFIHCLKAAIIVNDRSLEKNVDYMLNFAAKFTISLVNPESEEPNPFLEEVFKFIFEIHNVYESGVRLHCCQFLNHILNSLGPNGSLDMNICDKIISIMMDRMQDKIASVRVQAVNALHRLQDPTGENCKIIEVFLYHMTRDPSPEVRSAVINNILVTQRTLTSILSRINDIKDVVRRDAFIICSKVNVQKYKIKQRQMMLNSGFMDQSDKVRLFAKEKLLPKWLNVYHNDYATFLRALNVHSEIGLEVSIKCLKVIFSHEEKIILVDYLISRMKDKFIPFDSLNPEITLFWQMLAKFLKPAPDSETSCELFDKIVPSLTDLADYMKRFFVSYDYAASSPNDYEELKIVEKEFILMQLVELTYCYDLSDEYGRKSFAEVCIMLLKDPQLTIKSIPLIISRFSWAVPDTTERIRTLVELISDLREPFFDIDNTVNSSFNETRMVESTKVKLLERLKVLEHEKTEAAEHEDFMIFREVEMEIASLQEKLENLENNATDIPFNQSDVNIDPVVATKILKIINEMIDTRDITKLTPTLRSLFDNVVLPSFKKNMKNSTISSLSLATFGLFCMLDLELAKQRFILFCFLISNQALTVTALKAVFDLLQMYGLPFFSLKENYEEDLKGDIDNRNSLNSSKNKNDSTIVKYVLPMLYSLLDSEDIEVRNLTATGLCKLLLMGRLRSHYLVAKIICIWFHPISAEGDPALRQILSLFFKAFIKTRGSQYILEKAFIPTLVMLFEAPPDDPLSEVNVDNVVKLMINITNPEFGIHLPKGYVVHHKLTKIIYDELFQTKISKERSLVLVKALCLLSLENCELDFIEELINKAEYLSNKFKNIGDKNSQRCILKFGGKLALLKEDIRVRLAESEICNTLATTGTSENATSTAANISQATTKSVSVSSEEIDSVNSKGKLIDASVKKEDTAATKEIKHELSVEELESEKPRPFTPQMPSSDEEEEENAENQSLASSFVNTSGKKNQKDLSGIGIIIPASDDESDPLENNKKDDNRVISSSDENSGDLSYVPNQETKHSKLLPSNILLKSNESDRRKNISTNDIFVPSSDVDSDEDQVLASKSAKTDIKDGESKSKEFINKCIDIKNAVEAELSTQSGSLFVESSHESDIRTNIDDDDSMVIPSSDVEIEEEIKKLNNKASKRNTRSKRAVSKSSGESSKTSVDDQSDILSTSSKEPASSEESIKTTRKRRAATTAKKQKVNQKRPSTLTEETDLDKPAEAKKKHTAKGNLFSQLSEIDNDEASSASSRSTRSTRSNSTAHDDSSQSTSSSRTSAPTGDSNLPKRTYNTRSTRKARK